MAISAQDLDAIRDAVWNKIFTQDPWPQGVTATDLIVGTRKTVGDVYNAVAKLPAGTTDPAAIANAIATYLPADLAKQVADELGKRLAG